MAKIVNFCNGCNVETTENNVYLDNSMLRPLDMGKRIHILISGTGSGKTAWVKSGQALEYIRAYDGSVEAKDLMLLTPRVSIFRQSIKDGLLSNAKTSRDYIGDKIEVDTLQSFVRSLSERRVTDKKWLIIDECHTLLLESSFAVENAVLLDYIEQNRDIHIIGITATPEVWKHYNRMSVDYISKYWIYNYHVNDICIFSHTSFEKLFECVKKRIDKDNRAWVYCRTAEEAFNLSQTIENSSFICSSANAEYGRYSDTNTQAYILENEKYPDDIYSVFTTSVNSIGINIHDARVKYAVVNANRGDEVIQSFSRLRNDLEHLYVNNFFMYNLAIANKEKWKESYTSAFDNNVYKNVYADIAQEYAEECWRKSAGNRYGMGNKTKYFKIMFCMYAEQNKLRFIDMSEKMTFDYIMVRQFDFTPWLGTPLFKKHDGDVGGCYQQDLCEAIGMEGRFPTLLRLIGYVGIKATEKRVGNRKCYILDIDDVEECERSDEENALSDFEEIPF